MANDLETSESTTENTDSTSFVNSGDAGLTRCLSVPSEKEMSPTEEPHMTGQTPTAQNVVDARDAALSAVGIAEELPDQAPGTRLKEKNVIKAQDTDVKVHCVSNTEDKENATVQSTTLTQGNTQEEDTSRPESCQEANVTASKQPPNMEDRDAEVVRRAQEEGHVNVVFPGTVTQEGCCRFISEILKCILYQRQQLPMMYDQLIYSQKKLQVSMQDKDTVCRRPVQSADMGWRKCQQTLQELEEVLQQLEVLFSLSRVPRVLLLMGGSLILPKEMYEINMEALLLAGGDQCLRVSSCLRQLFRTLFMADLLSDSRPVRLMATTVLVLAHRDCGVGWFRPKLQFKVPTHVKNQVIALSSDPSICKQPKAEGSDWQDYVWFQAPVTIKGFSN